MLRKISLAVRKVQSRKEIERGLNTFNNWQQAIHALPAPQPTKKKLLIIRLDDIGDYLLFRNTLPTYKSSSRWQGYYITLLGNIAWQSLFEYADNHTVDEVIWVQKNKYYDDENYRVKLWQDLREAGYEVVICTSRARPMLLDDICMMAAAPVVSIAGHNELLHKQWNTTSDHLYTELFPEKELTHEFAWNEKFANWVNKTQQHTSAPEITDPKQNIGVVNSPFIICFIGGSKKSHRWPAAHWIAFIEQCKTINGYNIVIAGGNGDKGMAAEIAAKTSAYDICGKVSLTEMISWMYGAEAIVSNDTMAVHMSVSCGKPTLIIANGDNFYKFCGYKEAGIGHVDCVYPEAFIKEWKRHHYKPFRHYVAVTADIATISPPEVLNAFKALMNTSGSNKVIKL